MPLSRGRWLWISKLKIHWGNLKIFFSKTTGPISTKLDTKHPWVKGTQGFYIKGPFNYQKGDDVFFLSKSTLWYNYCFGQMCLLIWTGFSSERCNPWTCCFHFRQCETLSSWTLQTSDKWQHLLSTFQVSFCLLVCHFKLFETWFYLITQVSYLNQSFYLFKVSRRIHSRYTRNKCYRYNMQEGSPHNFNYISANTVYLTLRLDYQGLPSILMSLDWLGCLNSSCVVNKC